MSHHVGCDFFAGWISGVAGIIVGQPMDTIKVYQQVYGTSAIEAFKVIHQRAGWTGLYRGMSPLLLTSGVMNSVFFGSYGATLGYIEDIRAFLMNPKSLEAHRQTDVYKAHHGSYLDIFLAGCVAQVVPIFIACPSDVIKVRCQAAGTKEPSTSVSVMRAIVRHEGITGFYRGMVAMLWRDMPAGGIYMMSYEMIKDCLSALSGHPSDIYQQFLAGGCAGSLSWVLTVPMDTVKSQVQASHKKLGIASVIKSIIEKKGIIGLTRGTGLICLRAFPVNAVTFVAYEHIYKHCAATLRHKDTSPTIPDTEKQSECFECHFRCR